MENSELQLGEYSSSQYINYFPNFANGNFQYDPNVFSLSGGAKLTFGSVGADANIITPVGNVAFGGHFKAAERDLIGAGFDTNNNIGLLPYMTYTNWNLDKTFEQGGELQLGLVSINIYEIWILT